MAFFGMILLCSSSFHIGSQRLIGDALAVLTAGFYAAYLIVMAAARERAAASSLAFASSLLCSVTLLPSFSWLVKSCFQPQSWTGSGSSDWR